MVKSHYKRKRKKYIKLVSTLQKYNRVTDHLLLPSSRLWNVYNQFKAVTGLEAAKVLSPQLKRGHWWPIKQCPPWGITLINKEGDFFLSSVTGRRWGCLRTLKNNFFFLSFTLSYIQLYMLQRLLLHFMAV